MIHLFLQVVPISFLVGHSETSWMKILFDWTKNLNSLDSIIQSPTISSCGRPCTNQIRRILCSEDIGIKLLGKLKVFYLIYCQFFCHCLNGFFFFLFNPFPPFSFPFVILLVTFPHSIVLECSFVECFLYLVMLDVYPGFFILWKIAAK